MELNFTQIDNKDWVAEFEVKANFNIHLERDTDGKLEIKQKTAGTKYVYVNETGWLDRTLAYDNDFGVEVAPKKVQIVSAVKPSLVVITAIGGDENITVSNGILEYHFEIPMEEDYKMVMKGYVGSLEGDFTDIISKLESFWEKNKVDGYVPSEVVVEKTNITVNQYRVISMYGPNGSGGFDMTTDAPLYPGGSSDVNMSPTVVYFEHGEEH